MDGTFVLDNGSPVVYKANYANEKSVENRFVPYHPGKENLFPPGALHLEAASW